MVHSQSDFTAPFNTTAKQPLIITTPIIYWTASESQTAGSVEERTKHVLY